MSARIGRPHRWASLSDPAVGGVELWSLITDEAEAWRTPLEAINFLRDPSGSIDRPPRHNIERWDELCRQRRMPAIAGLDAHESGLPLPGGRTLSPFRNRCYFPLLSTHVLCHRAPSGALDLDRAEVYGTPRAGRCYLARDDLGDPRGFGFAPRTAQRRWASGFVSASFRFARGCRGTPG